MAQEIHLVCDWCPGKSRFAVATLALTNGRVTKSTPTLDLCKKHVREMHRMFKSRRKRGATPPPRPAVAREGRTQHKRSGNYGKKEKYDKLWAERKRMAMAIFNKSKEPITYKALRRVPNLQRTLAMLKADGKIKREGWSKGARWSLV
jgi:hypothetical protein